MALIQHCGSYTIRDGEHEYMTSIVYDMDTENPNDSLVEAVMNNELGDDWRDEAEDSHNCYLIDGGCRAITGFRTGRPVTEQELAVLRKFDVSA